MNKKIIIAIGLVIVIGILWYLISPLWRNLRLNEESPLVVQDKFETMNNDTRRQFEEAVKQAESGEKVMQEDIPGGARLVVQGIFKPRAHDVQGEALLIEQDGKRILRFENFKTINGPNLHIYLGSELGNADFIDLGKIRATEGNANYEVDSSVDVTKYNKVMVWCVPFSVLFSYAELK